MAGQHFHCAPRVCCTEVVVYWMIYGLWGQWIGSWEHTRYIYRCCYNSTCFSAVVSGLFTRSCIFVFYTGNAWSPLHSPVSYVTFLWGVPGSRKLSERWRSTEASCWMLVDKQPQLEQSYHHLWRSTARWNTRRSVKRYSFWPSFI